jgi:hypothetical protein
MLREPIRDILVDHFGVSYAGSKATADAILAAIRTHMTSPEAVERGLVAYDMLPNVYGKSGKLCAAYLAALGEE